MNAMTGARACVSLLLLLAAVPSGNTQPGSAYQLAAQEEAVRVESALKCLKVGVVALRWDSSRAQSATLGTGGIFTGTSIDPTFCADGGSAGVDSRVIGTNWLVTFYTRASDPPKGPDQIDRALSDVKALANGCADTTGSYPIDPSDANALKDCIAGRQSSIGSFEAFLVVLGPLQDTVGTSIAAGFPVAHTRTYIYTNFAKLTSIEVTLFVLAA